ncbi:hypothetical protein VTK56DRAFT_2415 [Thermocarpiscus australiensis]
MAGGWLGGSLGLDAQARAAACFDSSTLGAIESPTISEEKAEELVESLARALNAAEIPCVLWGHFLWATHGVPTYIGSLDLVTSLAAARDIVTTGHFSQRLVACPDTTTCLDGTSPNRTHPHPAFHVHIEGVTNPSSLSAVCLFPQSETLWFLPPLSPYLASPRAHPLPRYLALACDRTALPPFQIGMGRGAFDSDQTVVLVPKVHVLTEALMRIMARDAGKIVGGYAVQHFAYIDLYVHQCGFLDIGLLPEPFGKIYEEFREGPVPTRDIILQLRRAVGVPVDESLYR